MNRRFNIFPLKKIVGFLVLFYLVLLIAVFFIGKSYLRSYRLLTQKELIADVTCGKTASGGKKALNITLYPNTASRQKKTLIFDADEWVIESRIIQWKLLFSTLGIKRYYRIERISGRYFDTEKERYAPRFVYEICPGPDILWKFFYKYQKLFPFIEAVYGNSAFVPFEYGKEFQVYITSTGLMIKDVTVPKKRSWWQVG